MSARKRRVNITWRQAWPKACFSIEAKQREDEDDLAEYYKNGFSFSSPTVGITTAESVS